MDEFDYLEFDSWSTPRPEAEKSTAPAKLSPSERGRRCRQRGDFYEAAQWFESAVQLNDHDFGARVMRVDSLVRAGMVDEADRASAVNLKKFGRVREHYGSRALVLAHLGQFAEARRHCTVALEGDKHSAYAHCVRGELTLLEDAGDFENAMRWFEQAVDFAEDRWEANVVAGTALLRADLPMLAAPFFAEAGHFAPLAAYSWVGLGDCFAELRLYDQALFYYRRVLQVDPSNAAAMAREKKYAGGVYGLMKALYRPNLMRRWNEAYDKMLRRR